MKFDMHCHTKEGSLDGKVPIEDYIAALISKGFGGMMVSDHNSYDGYRKWKQVAQGKAFKNFMVLKGIEYDTIDAGHILVIMPERIELKILEMRGLPVQFLIDIVHKYGGVLGPAHPCGEKYLSITNTSKHRNQLAVMDKFDFVEGFNSCESADSNRRAMEIARQFQKPVTAGSDAHKMDCVGLAYTELPDKVQCESDFIACIKANGIISVGGNYYHKTTKDKIGKANHLLVESFWFYNRFGSLVRHHKRVLELQKYGIG